MGKLHELLAVESALEGAAGKIIQETSKVFKDGFLFQGKIKRLEMFDDADKTADGVTERLDRTTTVSEKLDYMRSSVEEYYDAVFQKDCSNQMAFADIEIDGETLYSDIPATFLLAMEKRLKQLRSVFEQIPTLEQGIEWVPYPEDGDGVFKTAEEKTSFKTRKTKRSMIVAPATKDHKAQVEVWDDTENCGKYIETYSSGKITPARKSQYMKKLDTLIKAVKEARQRANCVEVPTKKIGKELMDYLLND